MQLDGVHDLAGIDVRAVVDNALCRDAADHCRRIGERPDARLRIADAYDCCNARRCERWARGAACRWRLSRFLTWRVAVEVESNSLSTTRDHDMTG